MKTAIELSPSGKISSLGIMHLERYWQKTMARRNGSLSGNELTEEWHTDTTMLAMLGLGLEQTVRYLYNTAPDLPAFEQWILDCNNGQVPAERIQQFNALIQDNQAFYETNDTINEVLSADDLAHWEAHNYVIVRNAVPEAHCRETIQMVCDFLQIDEHDPATWYHSHPSRQGIMVQLFQHQLMERNRRAPRIRRAFEQLWQRKDIWVNTDRVGFNPPETSEWQFPGPRMHWDVSLQLPIPFGTQGILYLSDTEPHQGAFTLVPGFRHKIADWLHSLPAGADPRFEDLYALGAKPIAANAGDFIIWDHALPHGSSPNTSAVPRFVQYINYLPLDAGMRKEWK
jgi:hypothetical protein